MSRKPAHLTNQKKKLTDKSTFENRIRVVEHPYPWESYYAKLSVVFSEENGYIGIPQIVSSEKPTALIQAIEAFLRMDPDDPSDWYRSPLNDHEVVERVRKGITDLRYLTTLEATLQLAETAADKSSHQLAGQIRQDMAPFLTRINLRTIDILSDTVREPYADFASHEYHDFRKQIAEAIIQLQSALP